MGEFGDVAEHEEWVHSMISYLESQELTEGIHTTVFSPFDCEQMLLILKRWAEAVVSLKDIFGVEDEDDEPGPTETA